MTVTDVYGRAGRRVGCLKSPTLRPEVRSRGGTAREATAAVAL